MDKVYILKHKKFISGPYSVNELKIRGIKETEKVWYEGIKDWISPLDDEKLRPYIRKTKTSSNPIVTLGDKLKRLFKLHK